MSEFPYNEGDQLLNALYRYGAGADKVLKSFKIFEYTEIKNIPRLRKVVQLINHCIPGLLIYDTIEYSERDVRMHVRFGPAGEDWYKTVVSNGGLGMYIQNMERKRKEDELMNELDKKSKETGIEYAYTSLELARTSNDIAIQSNRLSAEANVHAAGAEDRAKISNKIAWLSFIVATIALVVSLFKK